MNINTQWKTLFERYNILEEVKNKGFYKITSDQIREFAEPRLMAYFDERSSLPDIFKTNGLSILSISRTEYMIGPFELYLSLDYKTENIERISSSSLETLNPIYINNESSALLFAFNKEILRDAFEIDELYFTISGRTGTIPFIFNINGSDEKIQTIHINKAQIEIDAGFESDDEIFLVEAKNRFVNDVNLKQLYYPFRLWSDRVAKEITPVFIVYSDSTFHVFIYSFKDPNNINSIEIIKSKKYIITNDEPITIETLTKLLDSVSPTVNKQCQFPQADSFEKIVDLMDYVASTPHASSKDAAEHFNFAVRQSAYYSAAAKFLGLIEIKNRIYVLSEKGKDIQNKSYREKHLDLIKLIISDKVFNEVLKKTIISGEIPQKEEITSLIRRYYFADTEKSNTPERRAGTVSGWIRWILSIIE